MGLKTGKRWFFIVVAGLFLALILLYFARPLYLPDRYFKEQIETRLSSALGMDVRIGKGRFRLLSRADLFDVALRDTASTFELTISRLSLRYRILPLLRRRLTITDFEIVQPRLAVRKITRSTDLSSSHPASPKVLPSAALVSRRVDTTAAVYAPPVAVVVERFHLEDGGVQYALIGAGRQTDISIQGLNATGENISFQSQEDHRIILNFTTNDTLRLLYRQEEKSVHITAPTDLSAEIHLTPADSKMTLDATFKPVLDLDIATDATKRYPVPVLEINAAATVLKPDSVKVKDLRISSGGNSYLRAEGTCFNLFDLPDFDLRVHESRLDLTEWWGILNEVAPLFGWDRWLRRRFFSGGLRFSDTRINGALRTDGLDLQAQIRWKLENVTYRDEKQGIAVVGLNEEGTFSGVILPLNQSEGDFFVSSETAEIRLPEIAGIPFQAEPFILQMSGSASPGLTNAVLDLKWKDGTAGLPGSGELHLRTDSLNLADPAASRNLSLAGRGSLEGIALSGITANSLQGMTDVAFNVELDGKGKALLNLDGNANEFQFQTDENTLAFAQLPFSVSLLGKINSASGTVQLDSLRVKLPPYINFEAETNIQNVTRKVEVNGDLFLDVGAVYPAIGNLLPQRWRNLQVNGIFAGNVRADRTSGNSGWNADLQIRSENFSLSSPQDGMSFRSPDFFMRGTTRERRLQAAVKLSAGVLSAAPLRRDPYPGINLELDAFYDIDKARSEGTVTFAVEALGLRADAKLTAVSSEVGRSGKAELRWGVEAPREVPIARDWGLSGKVSGKGRLTLKPDAVLSLVGELTADDLNLRRGDDFSLRRLKLRIPFEQRLNLGSTMPEFARQSDIAPLSDPILFTTFEHLRGDSSRHGIFSCSSLQLGNYTLENLKGDVIIGAGIFTLPVFKMQAYGGEIQGSLFVDYPAVHSDSIRYRGQLYGLNLDTALLPHARRRTGEGSKISAFARFRGRGINPDASFDLNGSLDITRIGRRVADNILRFLDPDQKDPSVQTYRKYLRRGWGIKMFSFEMKDDFVYASITPSKPSLRKPDQWILSRFIGLGKSVNFSRVPLKFLITPENF